MNVRIMFGVALLVACACSLTSCSDDKAKVLLPLKIEKIYYEVMLKGFNSEINVENGSLDISLSVKEPDVIDASFSKDKESNTGSIRIDGKQKGSTELTVTDNVTKERVNLVIKVIDTYLACPINESNHPLLSKGVTLFFVNNEARNFFLFTLNHITHTMNTTPTHTGTYSFSLEKDTANVPIPYLTLNYASGANKKPGEANTTPMIQRFIMNESSQITYQALEHYLNFKWDSLAVELPTRSSPPMRAQLVLKEDSTGFSASGDMNTRPLIPNNILK